MNTKSFLTSQGALQVVVADGGRWDRAGALRGLLPHLITYYVILLAISLALFA